MRPLTEEELKAFFEKLAKYIGRGIKSMLQRPDGAYCFRLHQDRVYYVSERQVKLAASFPREKLMGMGTLLGKFSKERTRQPIIEERQLGKATLDVARKD